MARTAAEIQTELDLVNVQIASLLADSAASIAAPGGRAVTFRNLAELRALRKELNIELASVSAVRPAVVKFQRPSA